MKELLVDSADKARPGLDALAYAYIYLQVPSPALLTLFSSLSRDHSPTDWQKLPALAYRRIHCASCALTWLTSPIQALFSLL